MLGVLGSDSNLPRWNRSGTGAQGPSLGQCSDEHSGVQDEDYRAGADEREHEVDGSGDVVNHHQALSVAGVVFVRLSEMVL